ncbi:hypothetical protein EV714DRAFT_269123 [Schizophyllum commune]
MERHGLDARYDDDRDPDAPFVAVDPFRTRRGRWAPRPSPGDIEQGSVLAEMRRFTPHPRHDSPPPVIEVPPSQRSSHEYEESSGSRSSSSSAYSGGDAMPEEISEPERTTPGPPPVDEKTPEKSRLNISMPLESTFHNITAYLFQTIPTMLYLCVLLRLPALYFSRVARVFENADLSQRDIDRMAVARVSQWGRHPEAAPPGIWQYEPQPDEKVSVTLLQFKSSWEHFVENLLKEWKTLNVVSALLTSAVLTILQIDAAAADPVVRTTALLALVCTLMSLLYGCLYIIRFGSMKAMHKASGWADEARQTTTNIVWNVWVMLAMPAVWLSWSIILFLVSIMTFVWRAGTADERTGPTASFAQALAPRIIISAVLAVGAIYFVLVCQTFARYGDLMDRRWRERVLTQYLASRTMSPRPPPPPRSPTSGHGHFSSPPVIPPVLPSRRNSQKEKSIHAWLGRVEQASSHGSRAAEKASPDTAEAPRGMHDALGYVGPGQEVVDWGRESQGSLRSKTSSPATPARVLPPAVAQHVQAAQTPSASSEGHRFLEQELYKLRVRNGPEDEHSLELHEPSTHSSSEVPDSASKMRVLRPPNDLSIDVDLDAAQSDPGSPATIIARASSRAGPQWPPATTLSELAQSETIAGNDTAGRLSSVAFPTTTNGRSRGSPDSNMTRNDHPPRAHEYYADPPSDTPYEDTRPHTTTYKQQATNNHDPSRSVRES